MFIILFSIPTFLLQNAKLFEIVPLPQSQQQAFHCFSHRGEFRCHLKGTLSDIRLGQWLIDEPLRHSELTDTIPLHITEDFLSLSLTTKLDILKQPLPYFYLLAQQLK